MSDRAAIFAQIDEERTRQFMLPGSEWDHRNTPNDWVSMATHYIAEEVRRGGLPPDREEFQAALIKAAAVIVAALEHIPKMSENGHLR